MDRIGDWSQADLRRFIVNTVLTDPANQSDKELPGGSFPHALLAAASSGGLGWVPGIQRIWSQKLTTDAVFNVDPIPQDFKHLLFLVNANSSGAGPIGTVGYRFNGNSGSDYDYQYILANNAAVNAANVGSTTYMHGADVYGGGFNVLGCNLGLLLNYAASGVVKTMFTLGGMSVGGAVDRIQLACGLMGNAPGLLPVTSMNIFDVTVTTFKAGSSVTVYGLG